MPPDDYAFTLTPYQSLPWIIEVVFSYYDGVLEHDPIVISKLEDGNWHEKGDQEVPSYLLRYANYLSQGDTLLECGKRFAWLIEERISGYIHYPTGRFEDPVLETKFMLAAA